MNALFFWFFSIAMIVCGLSVILSRNPVTSAICFAFTIFYMSALFVMLNAFFLAAVQILITAGAVLVLFLFIIMLLDLKTSENRPRHRIWMGFSFAVGLGFIYIIALTLHAMPQGAVDINSAPPQEALSSDQLTQSAQLHPGASENFLVDLDDDTHRIGKLLFSTNVEASQTTYVAPFEVTSLLILVATIGVIVLCKQPEPRRPSPTDEITREAPPVETKKEPTLTR